MINQRARKASALAAAVLMLLPGAVLAEEELDWFVWSGEGGAALVYGVPESDHVLLSFSCENRDGPVILDFPYEPRHAQSGAAYALTLQAGDRRLTLNLTGSRMEMDDLFVLGGEVPAEGDLKGLLMGTGGLKVVVDGDITELPLKSAGSDVEAFFAVCHG